MITQGKKLSKKIAENFKGKDKSEDSLHKARGQFSSAWRWGTVSGA